MQMPPHSSQISSPPKPVGTRRNIPRLVAAVAGLYAAMGGLVSLGGWAFNWPRLTDWANDGISSFVNTALCAVACGVALLLLVSHWAAQRIAVRILAISVIFVAGLTLSEHVFGWNLGIDTFLFSRTWGQQAAAAPMRMGPPACISFATLGIALILATWGPRSRAFASVLAILPIAVASLSLTGYWFKADELFGIARFTGIAFQTSTMIAALGIGLVAALPQFGIVAVLQRQDAGGAVLRRLILPVIIVPLLLGWLRILGQNAGLYDIAFGTALRTLLEIAFFFGLLWWTAAGISKQSIAAQQAQARLAAIVESSDDVIVSKSLEGIIRSWNAGAERIFGYRAEETIGKHISLIIPPDRLDEETEILRRIRRGERIDHFETVRLRKDGARIDVSLTVSPMRDAAGNIVGALKIARDITEQKRAVDERLKLLDAERAARNVAERAGTMKDEFLATLSHELRTPLNAIYGWSQLLATGSLSEEETRQGIDAIQRNAKIQTQLIDDLLDMNRIISGKVRLDVQPTDLANVVDLAVESVRPAAEAKQIRLRKIVDPHAGPISGDPTRLQQIIWNLLSNALKFTPKEGSIEVLLQRVNSHVELTISDSGIGIKPDFIDSIFERFRQADASTTRSHGGLGLGLSIVKNLVELHGGTVCAKSEGEGKGTTFIVAFPLAPLRNGQWSEHPTSPKSPEWDSATLPLAGVKVLVVDDEPDARKLIQQVLSHCNAEVTTARNANEAIQMLLAQRPDVIVSDIGMPSKDGFQFIREVRGLSLAEGGQTPAIALTAYARSEDRTRAMMAGFQVHIAKPIEPKELIATVGSVVGRTAPNV